MFALRELPNDTTGFSPFELLYGRQPRGLLAVLGDLWKDATATEDDRDTFQYVLKLREKLTKSMDIAKEN